MSRATVSIVPSTGSGTAAYARRTASCGPPVHEPREELGEDDAAVAAGAEQRPVRAAVAERAQRRQEVVPRVAVGDREDVQLVDLFPVALEVRDRALEQGGQTAFVTLPAFRQRVHT